jgi:hypothetical protein
MEVDDDDYELQLALALSMQASNLKSKAEAAAVADPSSDLASLRMQTYHAPGNSCRNCYAPLQAQQVLAWL